MKFRKGINFSRRISDFEKKEKIFSYIRKTVIIITLLIVLITGKIIYDNIKLSIDLKKITQQRNDLLESISQNTARNQKLAVIAKKIKLLKEYLNNNDVNFNQYYSKVSDLINLEQPSDLISDENSATESAEIATDSADIAKKIELKTMTLSTDQKTTLVFNTFNQESYKELLELIENPDFLDLFSKLELKGIILDQQEQNTNLEINLEGVFNKLTNDYDKKE
ncbi:MAG: hypothetical protein KatS3mg090_0532 [Patescibacteria group bacterium]|nr:MAG: hypothetical protein KatS3mg090_0532 [Patescibacteria group bacterium]